MRHYPLFLDLRGKRIVLSGGGETALAKLRLLTKTEARIDVFAPNPVPDLVDLAAEGGVALHRRTIEAADLAGAALAYAAEDDEAADDRTAQLARAAGVLLNVVDNLRESDFLTPAIVDRDPVVVAIGTEGAAPVLARRIKAELEARLPASLGQLVRIGRRFRTKAATLPQGERRRSFWARFYDRHGPESLARGGEEAVQAALDDLLREVAAETPPAGHVWFVGAGPGDPDLLTMKARRALDEAEVVIFDRLVAKPILELARREAMMIDAGKKGFGPAVPQAEIDAMIAAHAAGGAQVVRLKSGDPTVFGRLDEEIAACEAAGVSYTIVPGITAASAAVAQIGQSLTRRGRNASVRLLTGHDVAGFADHDWAALAHPGEVAAIYMGKRAARFVQGRLLMHGADPATPVTVVENASRPDSRTLATTLGTLEPDLARAGFDGPALILLGLAPRQARDQGAMPAEVDRTECHTPAIHLPYAGQTPQIRERTVR